MIIEHTGALDVVRVFEPVAAVDGLGRGLVVSLGRVGDEVDMYVGVESGRFVDLELAGGGDGKWEEGVV